MFRPLIAAAALLATLPAVSSQAHDAGIHAEPSEAVMASFDIVETTVAIEGDVAHFTTRVRGEAGVDKPDATGAFAGYSVYAYVWPTSLNSGDIGFEQD